MGFQKKSNLRIMCKRLMPNSQIQIVRDTHSLIAWEEWVFIDKGTKFVWQWSHSALIKVSEAVIFVFNDTNLHQILWEFFGKLCFLVLSVLTQQKNVYVLFSQDTTGDSFRLH
jgi:hypothetical protein